MLKRGGIGGKQPEREHRHRSAHRRRQIPPPDADAVREALAEGREPPLVGVPVVSAG